MELIVLPWTGQARRNAQEASPYDHVLGQAMAVLGTYSRFEHPITQEHTDTKHVAILMVISDRGVAGVYSATILHETDRLIEELVEEDKEPMVFTLGRHAQNYSSFRGTPIGFSWTRQSDRPSDETIEEVAITLPDYFLQPTKAGGVAEICIVFIRYVSMVSQVPKMRHMLSLEVADITGTGELDDAGGEALEERLEAEHGDPMPPYKLEPEPSEVLDILPVRYMGSHIRNALLQSTASELTNRQQAMHAATDNAEDLIITYTRLADVARQSDITQETAEIVSGVDVLKTE